MKVVHGDIFVAERFIGWQEKLLDSLRSSFDPKSKVFSSDAHAKVIDAVKGDEGLSTLNDKQLKQLVMPFTKFKIEEVATGGSQVRSMQILLHTNLTCLLSLIDCHNESCPNVLGMLSVATRPGGPLNDLLSTQTIARSNLSKGSVPSFDLSRHSSSTSRPLA